MLKECPKCGNAILIEAKEKTTQCPKCGNTIKIQDENKKFR
ncbi:Zn finger protein C2C2 type [Methanonatronarchaeum thermophilum]|uniref:Zn finger protein C2C2 type n=1 Tax=Methanonatronarchaeum thermophilum TaxID=1927129 RepID=A0A1Y3GB43_9EURY|nr:hypothetical protein [Methanonatronarchaeum thermophilum]OUJ18681.1 Zn finger protein C2C2 type [Methanonatronarchaeum thermophilum]